MALFELIERYPREVEALAEKRRDLYLLEGPDEGDPARPDHRRWRSDCEGMFAEGEAIFRERRATLRYIAASTVNLRRHLDATGAALKRMLIDDAYRAFDWLSREGGQAADDTRTIPSYAPRYDELAKWAESLASTDDLPETNRHQVSEWQTGHDECLRRRAKIEEEYPDRTELHPIMPAHFFDWSSYGSDSHFLQFDLSSARFSRRR